MARLSIIFSATLLVCMSLVNGASNNGTYNLIQGNCSSALARDVVYREYVHKYGVPLVERSATSSWYGDQKIYCLRALNENDVSKGGVAYIKEGGVNHTFVTIEMNSKRGNSLEYNIEIYGR